MSVTLNSFQLTQASPSGQSITVPTLTNGAVVVYIHTDNGGNTNHATALSIGGVSLTLLDSGLMGDGAQVGCSTFAGVGVPSGSQSISITIDGSVTETINGYWFLENVDQSSTVNAHGYNNSLAVTVTTSVSTFGVGVLFDGNITGASPISHQSGGQIYYGQDTNGMLSSGSITNTWTISGGAPKGGFVVYVKEVAAAGPANVKTWDGVTQSTAIKTYLGNTVANTKTVDGIN